MIDSKRTMRTRPILGVLFLIALAALIYYAFSVILNRQCPFHDMPTSFDTFQSPDLGFDLNLDDHRIDSLQTNLAIGQLGSASSNQERAEEQEPIRIERVPGEFQRAYNDREMRVFMDLLSMLDRQTTFHNITFFMNYGTLLGSFRHHTIIPWDDDADVAMPYSKKALIWSVLSSLASPSTTDSSVSGYMVNYTADTQLRFVHRRNSLLYSPSWPWRWPYIDIDLYSENSTHIWFYNSGAVYRYPRNIVFPLHRRPLGTLSLNSPRDSHQFLVSTYGGEINVCSNGMQHRVGRERYVTTRPCQTLAAFYPFVHRSLTWDGVVWEQLKVGNKSLYSLPIDEPPTSGAVNPFTLLKMTRL